MSLSKHPNVLRVRGSWLDGHKLHIALRLMNAGSAADVMHYAWPGGMEEEVIRCILKQALEGLKQASSLLSYRLTLNPVPVYSYLHINGFIHRDVKAANLLIDDDGTVLLGDLGVAAPLHDEDHTHVNESVTPFRAVISDKEANAPPRSSQIGKRRSFVGTVGLLSDIIIMSLYSVLISHAGWRQSSYPVFSMTRVQISGPLESPPWSWHRGVLLDRGNLLVTSFCKCE